MMSRLVSLLRAIHRHHKSARHPCGVASWGCRWTQLGGGEVNLSPLQIEGKSVCALQGLQILKHAVLVRRILVDNRHRTPIRVEYQLGRWVVSRSVDVHTDWHRLDDFPGTRIQHGHFLVV